MAQRPDGCTAMSLKGVGSAPLAPNAPPGRHPPPSSRRTGVVDLGGGRRLDSPLLPPRPRQAPRRPRRLRQRRTCTSATPRAVYIQEDRRYAARDGRRPPDFEPGHRAVASLRNVSPRLRPGPPAVQPLRAPVTAAVEETLDRSAAEINLWVDETPPGRAAPGWDLDPRGAAMVAEADPPAVRRARPRTADPRAHRQVRSGVSGTTAERGPGSCAG